MTGLTPSQYKNLLVEYLRPQKWPVFIVAILLFSSIGLSLFNPQILRNFIDTALGSGETAVLTQNALLFISLTLLAQIISLAVTYSTEQVGWTATNSLRIHLSQHIFNLDLTFHQAHTPGTLIERVDGDIATLNNFFSKFILTILGNGLLMIGIIAVMFLEDWRVGVVMLVYIIITLLIFYRIRHFAVPAFKAEREATAETLGFWEERLSGTADLRANGALPYTMQKQRAQMDHVATVARRMGTMGFAVHATYIALVIIGNGIAFSIGAILFYEGLFTIGTVYLIFHYISIITLNLRGIVQQIDQLQLATASIGRIYELLETKTLLAEGNQLLPTSHQPPAIQFDGVTFGYVQDTAVLSHLSFALQSGQSLGLLGQSGSGKSTIAKLIFRFYDPAKGTITLGGNDLRDWPLASLRQQVGLVTQNVELFQGTVRNNLTFFDETITDDRLQEAIHTLGLTPWLQSLDNGLETELSGSNSLSAGEAQLLAFARLFLQNPQLIILDEASSRLDPVTEAILEKAIDQLLKNRTAIIIAHRLATIKRADEVIILENGRIREQGSYSQLTQNPNSHFNQLLATASHGELS